jgi:hypothetical protein
MKTQSKTNRSNTEGWQSFYFAIALDNISDAEVEKMFSVIKEKFPVKEKKMKERQRATRNPRC